MRRGLNAAVLGAVVSSVLTLGCYVEWHDGEYEDWDDESDESYRDRNDKDDKRRPHETEAGKSRPVPACSRPAEERDDRFPVFVDSFDCGGIDGWAFSCNANQNNRVPDVCGYPKIDRGESFCSTPSSVHLYSRGSCLDPPFDGVTTALSKTIRIPNGDYRLVYGARIEVQHDGYCRGSATGTTFMTVNGVDAPDVGCDAGVGGACSIGWTRQSTCFSVTNGTANLSIVNTAGDCTSVDGWVDEVTVQPLGALVPDFPPSLTIACGASTDPSKTGTAWASGGCSPSVRFTDTVVGSCPGEIRRRWTIADGNTTYTHLQTITLSPGRSR